MALVKCKECGSEVSTKAEACPKCGAKVKPKRSGCGPLLVVVVIIMVLVAILKPSTSSSSSQSADRVVYTKEEIQQAKESLASLKRSPELDMMITGKKAVLERLKDPGSAEFRNVRYGDSEETGPVIYGFVNSKNSFGGYTGFQRFISNGRTTLIEEEDSGLGEAWLHIEPQS